PIFTGLSKRHLRGIAGIARERRFQEKETVAEEGKPGNDFYVILGGQAKVVKRGRTIATLFPGDFFGEIALLDGAPRSASVVAEPIFVIAAWAATRPNITKSFTESAARLRRIALEHAEKSLDPPDHLEFVHERIGGEDAGRLIRTVCALHHGLPKVYLVVQAWARLARRQRIPGTGREEVPARRGIPPWQEGVLVPGSASPDAQGLLDQITERLRLPAVPSSLFALAPAPTYLATAC